MNTSSARSRSLWPALASLIVLGSSAKVFAADPAVEVAPAAGGPASPASPATTQNGVGAIPAPPAMAPPSTAAPTTTTPIPVEPPPPPGTAGTPRAGEWAKPDAEPAAITDVQVQRLPAYAYPAPQTRGLPFGSLWLTFHGLQWPYMPTVNTDQRFVVGVSGWGWLDTAYQKFGPWGMGVESTLAQNRIRYLREQGRFLLRITPTYAFSDGLFIQGQVELVGTWIRRPTEPNWAAQTPMISSCASASGIAGTSR